MTQPDKQRGGLVSRIETRATKFAKKIGLTRGALATGLALSACGADTSVEQLNDIDQRTQLSPGVKEQMAKGKKLEFLAHTDNPDTPSRVVQRCDYVASSYEMRVDYDNVLEMDLSETDMVAHNMVHDDRYGADLVGPGNPEGCPEMIPVVDSATRDIRFVDTTPNDDSDNIRVELFDIRSGTFDHELLPGNADVVDGTAMPVVACVQLPGEGFCKSEGSSIPPKDNEPKELCHKPVLVDNPASSGDEREQIGNGEFRVGIGKPVHEPTEEIGAKYMGEDGEAYCRALTPTEQAKLKLVEGTIATFQGDKVCEIDKLDLDCIFPGELPPETADGDNRFAVNYTATYPNAVSQSMQGFISNTDDDSANKP